MSWDVVGCCGRGHLAVAYIRGQDPGRLGLAGAPVWSWREGAHLTSLLFPHLFLPSAIPSPSLVSPFSHFPISSFPSIVTFGPGFTFAVMNVVIHKFRDYEFSPMQNRVSADAVHQLFVGRYGVGPVLSPSQPTYGFCFTLFRSKDNAHNSGSTDARPLLSCSCAPLQEPCHLLIKSQHCIDRVADPVGCQSYQCRSIRYPSSHRPHYLGSVGRRSPCSTMDFTRSTVEALNQVQGVWDSMGV